MVEPKRFYQIVSNPLWVEVMHKELQALEQNHTWDLMPLPLGKTAIGCKWVYKVKYLANGNIERYKVRLIAKDRLETDRKSRLP